MLQRTQEVVVTGIRQLTDRIREYQLSSTDDSLLARVSPGSHVEVHFLDKDGSLVVRHYSIVGGAGTWDDPAGMVRIAVQREDRKRGSALIHETFHLGTKLRISRPINNFPLDRTVTRSLLLAGGIGITPIYAMLRSLVRRECAFEMVYSGRTREGLAYWEDVLRLGGRHARLHLSGPDGTDHLDLKALLRRQSDDTTVYVCGPAAMSKATHAVAQSLGWAPSRVRSEQFGAGANGDEVAFDVELKRSGRHVHVGRDTNILDALTAAGVDVLSDCRRGECGLCPLTILEADGPIDHRDHYLSEKDRASGKTLCICVSRVKGNRLVLDA